MLIKTKKQTFFAGAKKAFPLLLSVAFWLGLWQVSAIIIGRAVLLPTLGETFTALGKLVGQSDFWQTVVLSLGRVLLGYLIGVVLGILLGFFTALGRYADALASPLLSVLKAVPVASLILLLWVMVGRDSLPTLISAVMVMPLLASNVKHSLISRDKNLKEVCQVYKFSAFRRMRYYLLPTVLPGILSVSATCLGLAFKAGIATEVITYLDHSIGREIAHAQQNNFQSSAELFAWTLVVIFLSMTLEAIFPLFAKIGKKRTKKAQLEQTPTEEKETKKTQTEKTQTEKTQAKKTQAEGV